MAENSKRLRGGRAALCVRVEEEERETLESIRASLKEAGEPEMNTIPDVVRHILREYMRRRRAES